MRTHAKRIALIGALAVGLGFIGGFLTLPKGIARGPEDTVAKTAYGKIRGYTTEELVIWKGVPYAKPPLGELRWRPPEDPEPWTGMRDATSSAQKCTQLLTTSEWIRTGSVDPESGEDCLYLDIYRPKRPAYHKEELPVYVWIHGGSNNFGSAKDYDASNLAARSDLVVVVIQYRLGPMGWFYHPAVQTGGLDPLADSGNFGTLDHIQALKWIRENIKAFGGDPKRVTITGESAGGHNVMNLVVSPLSRGLFHGAMSQSGGMTTKSTSYARNLANTTIERVIRYLEGLDAAEATQRRIDMENQGTLNSYLRSIEAGTFFKAILSYGSIGTYDGIEDGIVIPLGGWIPAIRAGTYHKVPIILGSNQYETKAFMPLYGPTVKAFYGVPQGPYSWFNLLDVLKGRTKPDGTPFTLTDVLSTDLDRLVYEVAGYYGSRTWKAKFVDTVAHELVQQQDEVYAYLFKWGGAGSGPSPFDFIYGAGHAGEIAFFFGWDQGLFGYPFVPENEKGRKELQRAMMRYLSNFARTGNPNTKRQRLPRWEKWSSDASGPKAIVFDADFENARISMSNEELTIEGVRMELQNASEGMPSNYRDTAWFFQWHAPW